ncbi:MAG: hypothetical protein QOI42_901 [Frankiaceae bacterium]|nr:hypothetical protein [Frankiaceae bacterium]
MTDVPEAGDRPAAGHVPADTVERAPATAAERLLPGLDNLDLHTLLREVVERVEGVAALAERLQSLLQAVVSIGSHLALDEVLTRIVATAAQLVDAEYAAMGVLDPTGETLSQFVTHGIDETTAQKIGPLPRGHGMLGLLIRDPHVIRLTDLATHPASAGFPSHHPEMHTFLGVPVVVRGEAFGNLYLTEKRGGGPFTEADEHIVLALAAAAGLAVQNARLYEQAQRRQRWLQATSDVANRVLGGASTAEVFTVVVDVARDLAEADVALLALPLPDGTLRVVAAAGDSAGDLASIVIPRDSLSGRVSREGVPFAVADVRDDPDIWPDLLAPTGAGPAIFVPVGASTDAIGTLILVRAAGSVTFDNEVVLLAGSFAGQAALALRLSAAAADREQLAILRDRDRIARDLHDLVIQRLFATGMALESSVRRIEPPEAADRVRRAVDDLDATIKEIRSTIFALQVPAPLAGEGLRAAIAGVVTSASPALGFAPHLTFDGLVDSIVPQPLAEQLVAVLREALSNVARHAHASRVDVTVSTDGDEVRLRVADDGIGLPDGAAHSGLKNLASRARDVAGTFGAVALHPPQSGTVVEWTAPLR